jgi:hypothetical protein
MLVGFSSAMAMMTPEGVNDDDMLLEIPYSNRDDIPQYIWLVVWNHGILFRQQSEKGKTATNHDLSGRVARLMNGLYSLAKTGKNIAFFAGLLISVDCLASHFPHLSGVSRFCVSSSLQMDNKTRAKQTTFAHVDHTVS